MSTKKQTEAAKENIKKAQEKWHSMSRTEHAKAQPEGEDRARPGTKGEGEFYRIVVRPKEDFVTFRNQDVGKPGHIERLAGKRASGSWATQAWLVSKKDAHIEHNKLVPNNQEVKDLLDKLGSEPKHVKADIFEAKDRRNVPEKSKPTAAQTKARMSNIKKAQEAKRSHKSA